MSNNNCKHDYISLVSGHNVIAENRMLDYRWCKKCGRVKIVTTRDGDIVNELEPKASAVPTFSDGHTSYPAKCIGCTYLRDASGLNNSGVNRTKSLCELIFCYKENL